MGFAFGHFFSYLPMGNKILVIHGMCWPHNQSIYYLCVIVVKRFLKCVPWGTKRLNPYREEMTSSCLSTLRSSLRESRVFMVL